MYTQSLRTSEYSREEMRQRARHESFFGMKGRDPRPTSVATEIVDTDWDEEDIISDMEDDEPNSPRVSLNSSGQPSMTTLSSYEEAQTPRSSRTREAYPFDLDPLKPVVGPRGPHLFRTSSTSSYSAEYQETLSLSPLTPKAPYPLEHGFIHPIAHDPLPRSRTSPFQFTHEKLDTGNLALWSPEQVAQWMLNAGIELSVAEKFVENDINGAILITLKFEDLRELSIQSFGVRTKIWDQIHVLRESKPASPRPETPIEDEESKEVRRERRRNERTERGERDRSQSAKRSKSLKRSQSKKRPAHEDIISPLESVSIVGIEQMMPKPHHCSKGENCSKYRRQQRMIEAFKQDHPFVDMDKGGIIMVAGDPGNPETAQALNRPSSTEALRPISDAVPSVVASSDVLGPGVPPLQYLQEAALRNIQSRDPQDNVRQFLDFQHTQPGSSEVPPTPPFELYPPAAAQSPHEGLRTLPKLSIPGQASSPVQRQSTQQQQQQWPSNPQQQQQQQQPFVPRRMSRVEPRSPDLQTPTAPYRFGTPFSDMDVPLTAVPLGPVARDISQSVPPDMSYRTAATSSGSAPLPRSVSRASRRPSVQVMAPLEENVVFPSGSGRTTTPKPLSTSSSGSSPRSPPPRAGAYPQQPLRVPPRPQYPWLSTNKPGSGATAAAGVTRDTEGVTYQGPVRKRKTRMLRHEWHEQYATLKGTRLALHRDREAVVAGRASALEYIDVDDYAIACSSLSAGSKLNAAFKAMHISRHKHSSSSSGDGSDAVAAFSFQLIPQAPDGKLGRLRKRDAGNGSSAAVGSGPLAGSLNAGFEGAVNGTGKTHHFAVRSRDERIDWMRELMLAKALKQKGEGFEVSVNGNMI
ncbi:hypothetical protein DL766_002794 [Monosporascus sp. MC13-8B]|uniref:PH domain-containing protein n=1 Tax=Monosporascus cannonballus TaxID=155416 RepID=A0ABY0HAM7_9PEZI|nr:hypothetical protein DL762_003359 [Monosporascus cannonballus]RYP34804.1 hypothetical protein DL766_002794 [Monosporascus sp. MC13-8B]